MFIDPESEKWALLYHDLVMMYILLQPFVLMSP